MVHFFIGMFVSVAIVSWAWATGIDNMKENYPDYKGEDFLDWDDDKIHTEDKI